MIALGIVGGGASGLMAAITAGRLIKEQHMEDALSVTLLEAEESVGKKILATGNGRCNFTNRDFSMSKYHLEDENEKAFAEAVFRRFSVEDLCRFLIELGMGIRDRNGYLYPSTDQAGTVADLLIRELHRLPVKVCTGQTAAGLQVTDNGAFQVTTADHRVYSFHRLILATGTKAGLSPRQVKEREKDFLEPEAVARKQGISFIPFVPGLCKLPMQDPFFKRTHGVRMEGVVSLYLEKDGLSLENPAAGTLLGRDRGELQFTEKALSGIPVFQHSALALRALSEGKKALAVLDLLPDVSLKQLQEDIRCRCTEYSSLPAEEALLGLLPAKVLRALILYIGKDPETKAAKFLPESDALGVAIKSLAFPVKELPDLTTGQICSGGFAPEELTETMEVKKLPGLFVTGEAVNVDGICGGYNLQWAFSTGAVAGRAAASKGFV